MILIIDNYDSFTYNILHLVRRFASRAQVARNDAITLEEIERLAPAAIVLSAGPGTPSEAGVTLGVVRRFAGRIPILGICLGMQAIAEAFGGRIVRAKRVMQGKSSDITHRGEGLFRSLPTPMRVGRYHSLIVERENLPEVLRIDAETEEGVIMALSHSHHFVYGVQFHPESILTHHGEVLMRHFLQQLQQGAR